MRRLVVGVGMAAAGRRRRPTWCRVATRRRQGSFWSSLPGVLTAIAAIVTATAGLLGTLVALGVIHSSSDSARLQVRATLQAFGTVQVGQGSPASIVTISNSGKGASTVRATLGGTNPDDFKVTDNTCVDASLTSNTSCQLEVAFNPKSEGDKVATLGFNSDNAPSPPGLIFSGTGRGLALITFDPASVSISLTSILQGTPPTAGSKVLSISNTGTGNLTITTVRSDDQSGRFSVMSGCEGKVLAPNGACQVTVRFTATTFGQFSAHLQVFDNLSPGLQLVPLSGYRGYLILKIVPPSSQ